MSDFGVIAAFISEQRMQPNPSRKGISIAALAFGATAIIAAASALTLDNSLPYRIGPTHYTQFLWVGRLSVASLVCSIAAITFGIMSRQRLPLALGLVSPVSLLLFMSVVHSGPDPQAWCYNNLRTIDAAKQHLADEIGLTNGATITAEQISKYIEGGFNSFKCAEQGKFIIGSFGREPRCSVHGSESEMENLWKQGVRP